MGEPRGRRCKWHRSQVAPSARSILSETSPGGPAPGTEDAPGSGFDIHFEAELAGRRPMEVTGVGARSAPAVIGMTGRDANW